MLLYVLVLIGSLSAIAAILALKFFIQRRSVRRFVRSVHERSTSAEERGVEPPKTADLPLPHARDPRTAAIAMQQVRTFLRDAARSEKQGDQAAVEKILIQALTVEPKNVEARAELARLFLTTGREPKAEAMYRELLRDHDDVSFHANLALAYYRQEKYIEACQAYQEALNRDPKNPERSAALGRACIAAHRFAEAAPLLAKACSHLTRNTELLHLLAECHLQLGNTADAEEAYRRINRLTPYDEAVKEKLKAISTGGK